MLIPQALLRWPSQALPVRIRLPLAVLSRQLARLCRSGRGGQAMPSIKLNPVIHLINERGEFNIEPPHTRGGMLFFIFNAVCISEANAGAIIRLIRQASERMGFADIDQ